MKSATLSIASLLMAFILAQGAALAMPIPTSVYGHLTGNDAVLIIAEAYVNSRLVAKTEASPLGGRYVMVLTTDDLKKIDVRITVLENRRTLYERLFRGIETGSKLELNITLAAKVSDEARSTGGGIGGGSGGGGGTFEPKLSDIIALVPQDRPEDEETLPPADDTAEKGQEPQTDLPGTSRVSLTTRLAQNASVYLLAALVCLLLALMLIMMRLEKKHE